MQEPAAGRDVAGAAEGWSEGCGGAGQVGWGISGAVGDGEQGIESRPRRARRLCAGAETWSPTFSRPFPCGRPLTAQLSVSPAPAHGPWGRGGGGGSLTGRLFRR